MAREELFLTIHLEPAKQGISIEKQKYAVVQKAILHNLRAYGPMTFTQLGVLVEKDLRESFPGSVTWYYTTVKLDMEARGEIRRIPNSRPQVIEVV
jgi:hypothetical protein